MTDLRPALTVTAAIVGLRIVFLAFDRTDLFVDEAQYWLWGQELALGYFSKPPLIGWLLRAMSEIAPQATFWVRLPAPILHGATALILARLALMVRPGGTTLAAWVAAAYLTMPIVSVGSWMISTDTVMAPFLAAGLALWWRAGRGGLAPAALAGAMLGLAFMAKYAAVYAVAGIALAQMLVPARRLGGVQLAVMVLPFAIVIAPNLLWNLSNDMTTVAHTMENVGWIGPEGRGPSVNPGGFAAFVASQFGVMGPVLMAALVWAAATRRGAGFGWLALFALPPLAVVSVQALLDQAYANWAFAGLLAGVPLATAILYDRAPRWLRISTALNAALCLVVPLAAALPGVMRLPSGEPMAARYLGRAQVSRMIDEAARAGGASAILATDRDLLADLFWTLDGTDWAIYAPRPEGAPSNYYEQTRPLPDDPPAPVLRASFAPSDCAAARTLAAPRIAGGAHAGRVLHLELLPPACL
ncbi:hypothetical protein E2L08_12935 [Palleronia sediminis]|uniref:Glycosyltransferase RgtA/B/C/D-like domain-containing protein n=1 Tax=Palleronia sediminis TaxID=2547833 RepID=A0A4R6A2A8_9RHOB|nr:glycosyltransferase family 39 protein [Palleronia sediminis]TDL77690.1 hypothetical protein E2L08_12935 [Palleronia sediminis]